MFARAEGGEMRQKTEGLTRVPGLAEIKERGGLSLNPSDEIKEVYI